MLTTLNARRSFRNIKQVFANEVPEKLEWEEPLAWLQLPASLPTLEKLSNACWTWIHSSESANTRVYSPAAETVSIPRHLMEIQTDKLTRSLTMGRTPMKRVSPRYLKVKIASRCLLYSLKNQSTRSNDFSSKSIQGKPDVICIVGVDTQKYCTSILHLQKDLSAKGYALNAHPSEGFLFDVPSTQESVNITIRLYSTSESLPVSSSFDSINGGLFRRKSLFGSFNKKVSRMEVVENDITGPASPSDIGSVFAETHFQVETFTGFDKQTSAQTLVGPNGKEIARVVIQMGMFLDIVHVAEPLLAFRPHSDYLNLYLRSSGCGIWKKYWVTATVEGLAFHPWASQDAPPIGILPYSLFQRVIKPTVVAMPVPNCISLVISLPWNTLETNELTSQWKSALLLGGDSSQSSVTLSMSADSLSSFDAWMYFLSSRVAKILKIATSRLQKEWRFSTCNKITMESTSTQPNSSQPTPAPSAKKTTCFVEGCIQKPVKIVGDCRYCSSKFCGKHRLPEAHNCPNIQSCRAEANSKLANKLLSEKAVASRI